VGQGVRLVAEVNGDKPRREDQRDSALLGVIWQPWSSKNVWLDAGVRRGFTSGVSDWQFTFGITFGFSTSSLTKSSAMDARDPRVGLGTHRTPLLYRRSRNRKASSIC